MCASDEPDAERVCENILSKALEVHPNSVQLHQCAASFRLCQQREDIARTHVERAFQLLNSTQDDDLAVDDRVLVGKLCLELMMYEEATSVFESVLERDDTNMEWWYLLAEAYLLANCAEDCIQYCARAVEVIIVVFLSIVNLTPASDRRKMLV